MTVSAYIKCSFENSWCEFRKQWVWIGSSTNI